MIPEKYREKLPPYWYENRVAEYHFAGAGEEAEQQKQAVDHLGKQFLLPYATDSLDVWDWIFFGDTQLGDDPQRRENVRTKYLAKARFTMKTLQALGRIAGSLEQVKEDFERKEVLFEFAADTPLNLPPFYHDFEKIRPVHVKRAVAITKATTEVIEVVGSARTFEVTYPRCGTFCTEGDATGTLASYLVVVRDGAYGFDVTYPRCGVFVSGEE